MSDLAVVTDPFTAMVKTVGSVELREVEGLFYVGQHIQVDLDHYIWSLLGAGSTKYDAVLSAKLFCEGTIEILDKLGKSFIS